MSQILVIIATGLLGLFGGGSKSDSKEFSVSDCGQCVIPRLIRFKNKGYSLETFKKMNFFDAYAYCRYTGMYLYTPETEPELFFINNITRNSIYKKEDFWTSGNCLQSKQRKRRGRLSCSFMSTGLPIWAKMMTRIPNSERTDEFCIRLTAQTRHNVEYSDCRIENYFICETVTC